MSWARSKNDRGDCKFWHARSAWLLSCRLDYEYQQLEVENFKLKASLYELIKERTGWEKRAAPVRSRLLACQSVMRVSASSRCCTIPRRQPSIPKHRCWVRENSSRAQFSLTLASATASFLSSANTGLRAGLFGVLSDKREIVLDISDLSKEEARKRNKLLFV